MFESPNKDFTMHLGIWVQWDNVWWNQSISMSNSSAKNATFQGVASGGIGPLRGRRLLAPYPPFIEGTFWETFEYRFNFALENNQFNTAGLDEFWIGDNKLPVVGTIRVGPRQELHGAGRRYDQFQPLHDLHGTVVYSEAIELNQNFVTGLWLGNT